MVAPVSERSAFREGSFPQKQAGAAFSSARRFRGTVFSTATASQRYRWRVMPGPSCRSRPPRAKGSRSRPRLLLAGVGGSLDCGAQVSHVGPSCSARTDDLPCPVRTLSRPVLRGCSCIPTEGCPQVSARRAAPSATRSPQPSPSVTEPASSSPSSAPKPGAGGARRDAPGREGF